MEKHQFLILYRQFLFRVVELDLLSSSAQDANKLLGQFAALLIVVSTLLTAASLALVDSRLAPMAALLYSTVGEHTLIATTMLAVGLFAVLSWDSAFPDRRDVFVLAPLPIRARTLFLAKAAAGATAFALVVVTLHCLAGFFWPLGLAQQTTPVLLPSFSFDRQAGGLPLSFVAVTVSRSGGLFGFVRMLGVYWTMLLLAGLFTYCCVLGLQGLLAQLLPRRHFLRVSSFLQLATFWLFLSVYFFQPSPTNGLSLVQNLHLIQWLPSYWFLALFQQLAGSVHPALVPLAGRAWAGLAIATCGTAVLYLLSYWRTLRQIVEQPDIVPGAHRANWLPRFGDTISTALVQFSIRSLARSRQHRILLAFYLGIGLAITIFFMKSPDAQQMLFSASGVGGLRQVNVPLLASSMVMLGFWIVGMRVVFAAPLELRANWVFRLMPLPGRPACLRAQRRALLFLAVFPAWTLSAALFLWLWPWRAAAAHLLVLALVGLGLTECSLLRFPKIPFTCSYLPGKSNVHLTFWLCIGMIVQIVVEAAKRERVALELPGRYAMMLGLLGAAVFFARWHNSRTDDGIRFEELEEPVVLRLDLQTRARSSGADTSVTA